MKSLVVDDDNTCSFIFQSMLSKFGECETTSSGLDAVNRYVASLNSGRPYDLMVIDIMMPDMNGYEALQSIRLIEKDRNISFPFNVKVILTTALDDEENRKLATCMDPLSEAYLVKSSQLEGLLDKLTAFGFDISEAN